MNMLSAKKVRVHGMQSSRWGTKDKLTQYKGLINLFTRDRKILALDTALTRKKQNKEIKQLRNDIKLNREELDNAIQGDRQMLRNTLAEHKDMQLTFQYVHPTKVIDFLHQGNFNKRKLLDRLKYQMKQKTQLLINLKLQYAELEDRMKFDVPDQFPVELEAQLITGKVQDAVLKKEAALSIKYIYSKILSILKKDAIYFDAVLETIKLDGYLQGKCMVKTTELGQLATEYLDDRKQEFEELEKVVKRDMKSRELSLKEAQKEVLDLTHTMGMLIRKDNDINLGKIIIPNTDFDISLQQEIKDVEEIFTFLKDTTYVTSYEKIYPCLVKQKTQEANLKELVQKCTQDRNNLTNKKQHADKMYNTLFSTMNTTTFSYKKEKARLLEEIEKQNNSKEHAANVDVHISKLLVIVRSSLHQLFQKCIVIKSQDEKKEKATNVPHKVAIKISQTPHSTGIIAPPPHFEEDCNEIISILEKKITLLNNNMPPALTAAKKEDAYRFIYRLTTDTCSTIKHDIVEADDSLLTDYVLEDASVPSYAEVKFKSKELVEISTVNEDLVPTFTPKKKKFKFK